MKKPARVMRPRGATTSWRMAGVFLLMLTLYLVAGCSDTEKQVIIDPPPPTDRLQPSDVVTALVYSYKHRDTVEYSRILASDFQFWFDPDTRPDNVPEFWTRLQDSTGTGNLFRATDVTDIRITLTYGADVADNTIGHRGWRKIRVTDTFLEVDKVPPVGEVLTLRVDGDVQDFYLRKGRTPADTLASSPTSKQWYLVEWHDLARLSALKEAGATPAASQPTTWSRFKALYAK